MSQTPKVSLDQSFGVKSTQETLPHRHSYVAAQLGEIIHDMELLIRQELALAHRDIQVTSGKAIKMVAVLAAGMAAGSLGILFLARAMADFFQVALGVPLWGSYGVLSLALLGIATVLCLRGVAAVKEWMGRGDTPYRA